MENWGLYIIAGVATGILSSLFGVGGGTLMVPILTLAFCFSQKSAQGISLLVMIPTALAGVIRYKFNPDVSISLPVAGWMAIGGILGAVIGSHIVFNLSEAILKRMFAVFIIIIGINMFMKSFPRADKTPPQEQRVEKQKTNRGEFHPPIA